MGGKMIKYSIVDDESNLIVGTCDDIVGLSGECTTSDENESFHKIILENFQIAQTFKEYCNKTKSSVTNIQLCVMDIKGNSMGSYYFSLRVPLYFQKNGYGDKLIYVELIGTLLTKASKEALEIWEVWRQSLPTSTNLWFSLSKEQREGWLEVVRLYSKGSSNQQDEQHGVYSFDATYVTDSTSFFCALGEAINGPGGYFGFDLLSLEDCLCGGFGVMPPFTINLQNVSDFFGLDNAFFKQLNEIFTNKQVKLVRL
ncbi:barstar family protein [Paenibacillus durus]|uniref:barstar family protein n=1 Tax=Paenibacillus durus TaxID=44251 RepID=UPI000693BC20|nr:barstar family protein [Paenibacillus durus]